MRAPNSDNLIRRTVELGLSDRVHFHGSVPALERDQLVRTAWMSINTSKGEGWSLTVVEANALGVPVLALRVPGLRDSIRHGETGWLIDESADLPDAICRAVAELEDEPAARRKSRAAIQWAGRFTWHENAQRMASILEAERGRLDHRADDRRNSTDLAMVVHIPGDLLPTDWSPGFRATDRVSLGTGGLTVLLPGTDATSARIALRRAGLPGPVVDHGSVRTSVARPLDHIAPHIDGWRVDDGDPDLFIAEPIPGESAVVPLDPASR